VTVLAINELAAGYGRLSVLYSVSMHVGKGEAVAIVGANGAGKTTLIRAICGLIPITQGRIIKNAVDLTSDAAHRRARHGIAVVLENRRLFGEMTVEENLRLAEEHGQAHRSANLQFTWERICDLFPVLAERRRTRVELLSGGQQQMVAIARALLLQPDLLILDEPSTGLAPKIAKDILHVLRSLRSEGMGILLIEQNVSVAVEITERAYVMALGRIVHEAAGAEWQAFLTDERLAEAYLGSGSATPQ
jgi:ABC-type branched-subunit amino acid transport system ATPase component